MTRLRATFLLISLLWSGLAVADGVRFFHGSWSQLMAEARRQNKPVFVDMYTTWCGPCKLMAAQAFPNARVAQRMNENFICYKLDAEKGEGQTIAQRFGVQAYPTSLFLSVEGKLIRRTLGYNGVDWFLAEAQRALSDANESHTMALWNKRYDAGDRSHAFLRGMLRKQAEYDRTTGDVLDDYVAILPKADQLSEEEIRFLGEMLSTTYTKAYPLLAQKATEWRKDPARESLVVLLEKAFERAERNDLNDAVAAQDELVLESLIANKNARQRIQLGISPKVISPDQKALLEREADETRLQFYKVSRLQAHYVALVKKIAETRLMLKSDAELARADSIAVGFARPAAPMVAASLPDSTRPALAMPGNVIKNPVSRFTANQLGDLAKCLCDQSTDKKDMAMALRWTERAVKLDAAPANVIAHCRLLARLGRATEARQQLSRAIALQENNEAHRALLQGELARLK